MDSKFGAQGDYEGKQPRNTLSAGHEQHHGHPTCDARRPFSILETPVLIIGGGPVGLFQGILLAKHGIRSTIVERYATRLGQPKAHAVNPRSLEIMRQAGMDTDLLRRTGLSPAEADLVHFAASMTGVEYGNLPYERQWPETLAITPEPLFNIPQPLLEDYLYEVAMQSGLIALWKEIKWQSSRTIGGIEESLLLNTKTQRSWQIRSRYLLACDGANARSREQLEIPFSVLDGHVDTAAHHVSVHFKADLRKEGTGTLWFILSRELTGGFGGFICYDPASSWVFVMNYDPSTTPKERFTEAYCRSQIWKGIGRQVGLEILNITIWHTSPRVADYYRSISHPQAFLVGDAAHAFPPTGGLGINTGFADAHNLAWKISAVEKGWVDEPFTILNTYEKERRPVAAANARQSGLNHQKLRALYIAVLGSDDATSPEARMADPETREQIEAAIRDNLDHFDSINLQIGYEYGNSESLLKSCTQFVPRYWSGARLPHAWVKQCGKRCSTLDLIDGTTFVLISTKEFAMTDERQLFRLTARAVPVRLLRLGVDFTVHDAFWTDLMGLSDETNCAILLRPDQHIVGRVKHFEEVEHMIMAYLNIQSTRESHN